MKFLWLSATHYGYEWLKMVLNNDLCDVTAIVTLHKDSRTVHYLPVGEGRFEEFGVPVHYIRRISDETELIRRLSPDIVITSGWRQWIPPNILSIPEYGVVGFHPTLLPFGRGPAPIINSIMLDVRDSGLSMFYYSDHLDAGDIISQEAYVIKETDYAMDVHSKVTSAGKKLLKTYIPLLRDKRAPRKRQNERHATLFPKLSMKGNEITEDDVTKVYAKIRALSHPYAGAWIRDNDKGMVLWRATPIKQTFDVDTSPSLIYRSDGLFLACKDGSLEIEEWEHVDR